jgi:hypothetical protein
MSGLGELGGLPGFNLAGQQVQPRDIDQYLQYLIVHPGLTTTALGTVETAAAGSAVVFSNVVPDYPRNVLVTILGVAGGMGGTVTIAGKNQFGGTQTETIGFASAAGGGTAAGTKIFGFVNRGTVNGLDGLGGTAVGSVKLGYAVGTAAGIIAKFGLPIKIQATTDVKNIALSGQGVGGTAINGGTYGTALVDTTNHAFAPSTIVGGSQIYSITIKSTFDNAGKAPIAGL